MLGIYFLDDLLLATNAMPSVKVSSSCGSVQVV